MSKQYDGPLHMMEELGGSFVRALANAWFAADENNRARLHVAFADYFERYRDLFQKHKANQEKGHAE